MRNRVVFWQVSASAHQSVFLKELSRLLPTGDAELVLERAPSNQRQSIGWNSLDFGGCQLHLKPSLAEALDILSEDQHRSVHVYSSIASSPFIKRVILAGSRLETFQGLLSEGRDWRGLRGQLRTAHALLCERRVRSDIGFVLAIGHLGVTWFKRCGYSPEKIFPFCYVAESFPNGPLVEAASGQTSLVFVGQLVVGKRVDLLVRALSRLKSLSWTLRVIGEGPERQRLEELAKAYSISDRVVFRGLMGHREVRRELSKADLLVLPSRWDGWGTVVNEALMSGVPVLCSDFCGARQLISEAFNGSVFESDSLASLTSVLEQWIHRGPLKSSDRRRITSWSRCIEGASVARYFLEVLEFADHAIPDRPLEPWRIGEAIARSNDERTAD